MLVVVACGGPLVGVVTMQGPRHYLVPISGVGGADALACTRRCYTARCLASCPHATKHDGICDPDARRAGFVCGEWIDRWKVERDGGCGKALEPGSVSCDEHHEIGTFQGVVEIVGVILLIPLIPLALLVL
jgi:hypothetical protein